MNLQGNCSRAEPRNVAHDHRSGFDRWRIVEDRWIAEEEFARFLELGLEMEIAAVACCTVMMTPPQCFKDCAAIQPWGKKTCEPTRRPEEGRAGELGTGTTLVTVGTANNSYTVVLLEGVAQEPLEAAPARMDFDCGLDPPIMCAGEVCITAPT